MADCGGDKALGLGRFNFFFIRARWEFLELDICDMLSEFHRRSQLNKEINATILVFMLKVYNPVDLQDFIPTSLIGFAYKLSKILANRLKEVLPLQVLVKKLL